MRHVSSSFIKAGEFHILTICQDNKDIICVLRRLHAPRFIRFHRVSSSFIKTLVWLHSLTVQPTERGSQYVSSLARGGLDKLS